MKYIALLLTLTALGGCSVNMTQEARNVRVLTTPDATTDCDYMAPIEVQYGRGGTPFHNAKNALTIARNIAGENGANAMLVTARINSPMEAYVSADAYRCKPR